METPIEEMSPQQVKDVIAYLSKLSLSPGELVYLEALKDVDEFGLAEGLSRIKDRAMDKRRRQIKRVEKTPANLKAAAVTMGANSPEVQTVLAERDGAIGQLSMEKSLNYIEVQQLHSQIADLVERNSALQHRVLVLQMASPNTFFKKLKALFQ